jgi:DNA-directed RNA polymerase specialized sigma24 family protein
MSPKRAASSDGAAVSPDPPPGDAIAWQKLLEFIARESESPEAAYHALRERLVKFFLWRGSPDAEELADETFTRVALKLAQTEVQAERPAAFVLGVARMIDLEWRRREGRWVTFSEATAPAELPAPDENKERLLLALENCLQELSEKDRSLMLRYHEPRGVECFAIRQAIADELATGLNVLRVRMHRMRMRVEACVERRMGAATGSGS